MNLKLYNSELRCRTKSILNGEREEIIPATDPMFQIGVIKAFLEDDRLQEITVVSADLGFTKTFRKSYRPAASL